MNQKTTFTVAEFCTQQSISRATFYLLQKQGKGPRTYTVGRKRLISIEAATEWQQKMEGTRQADAA
jgi:predicted DNA-binding transcriptional regulator AlpA